MSEMTVTMVSMRSLMPCTGSRFARLPSSGMPLREIVFLGPPQDLLSLLHAIFIMRSARPAR